MTKKNILRCFLCAALAAAGNFSLPAVDECIAEGDMLKGVWVATVYNIDYPSSPTTNAKTLMREADEILDECESLGFNAVFFQVHPSGDALYKSDIFPYSKWLTGVQGTAPGGGFDPLEYWISGAHERGMELHAWINPYRITTSGSEYYSLSASNPAKQHPEYIFKYTNGNYYYNPALPEVRELIVDGIAEIADNYEVDGIHMDDYFYPGSDVNDYADYMKYNYEGLSLEDWRRSNCDALVYDIHEALSDRGVTFGISPGGVWANKTTDPRGSDTRGGESYSEHYADSRTWALEGWVDYIAPQLYWEIGNPYSDYATLVEWWCDTVAESDTKLYIGLAAYKAEDAGASSPWYGGAAIEEEYALNDMYSMVSGEIYYNYGAVTSNARLKNMVRTRNYTAGSENSDGVEVYLNGDLLEFDQKPVIDNGRTLVPMRAIFEALGMEVEWDGGLQRITASDWSGTQITMYINENKMYVNALPVYLDVPPKVIGSRTMVPVRAISESFGADVEWDGYTSSVYIWTE